MAKQLADSDIRLRDYHTNDADALVQLWYQTWHYAYPDLTHPSPIADWRKRFINKIVPAETITIAENSDGIILGFMTIRVEENYLSQLFIDVKYQRQGVGSCLINHAKISCPNQLNLYTLERNIQSRKFYEKHGFYEGEKGINPINEQVSIRYHWLAD